MVEEQGSHPVHRDPASSAQALVGPCLQREEAVAGNFPGREAEIDRAEPADRLAWLLAPVVEDLLSPRVGEAETTGEPERTSCPSPDSLVAYPRPQVAAEGQISRYLHLEGPEVDGSPLRPLPKEEEGVQTPRCHPPGAGERMRRRHSLELAGPVVGIGCCWAEVGVGNP